MTAVDASGMNTPFQIPEFLRTLQAIRAFNSPTEEIIRELRGNSRQLGKVLSEIALAREHLETLERSFDSILMPPYVFDLTNPQIVGEVIVYKLEQQPRVDLLELARFYGSGVYALYYRGSFSAYEAITDTEVPIYVGMKGPKVKNADTPRKQGIALYERITEHLNRSIAKADSTLNVADFQCRYLVVQSGWEAAAEEFLIRRYLPVWNNQASVCSGLGKHGDQPKVKKAGEPAGREEKSDWDILHPGRPWAQQQVSRSGATSTVIARRIEEHFVRLLRSEQPKWSRLFNPSWVAKHRA